MQPFRTILFAADFSQNSKEAFRVACSLAAADKTRMIILHVVAPDWVAEEPVYRGQAAIHAVARTDKARLDALTEKLREVYTPNQPIELEYCTTDGDPSVEILRMAGEVKSDLIVMGTHGRTGLRRLFAGSVAIAVLRGAHCPVLALRSPEVPRAFEDVKVMIHPTDFSVGSDVAAGVARSLACQIGARLILLHVIPLEVFTEGTMAAAIEPQVEKDALESVRKRLDGPDLKYPVETRIARGFVPDAILAAAQDARTDLIVVGTHGRNALQRVLMGSVAESLLRRASCPVMVVTAREQAVTPIPPRSDQEMVIVL